MSLPWLHNLIHWLAQGAFTGVCSHQHVPNYVRAADKIKAKGVDEIICVSVNDPYALNAWAEKLGAKDKVHLHPPSFAPRH